MSNRANNIFKGKAEAAHTALSYVLGWIDVSNNGPFFGDHTWNLSRFRDHNEPLTAEN